LSFSARPKAASLGPAFAASPIFAPRQLLLHLLPWMACMQALQEQMPATKKSELIEVPLSKSKGLTDFPVF
jgi:hypothetical protein